MFFLLLRDKIDQIDGLVDYFTKVYAVFLIFHDAVRLLFRVVQLFCGHGNISCFWRGKNRYLSISYEFGSTFFVAMI